MSPLPPDEPADHIGPAFGAGLFGGHGPLDFSGAFEMAPDNISPETVFQPGDPALVEKLLTVSFGDRAFLLRSEAEAWQVAVETLLRYQRMIGRPKRRRLIVCVGALADADAAPPGLDGDDDIMILRTDDLGALRAEINPKTAGFLIAPVRTRNGLEIVPGSLLAGLRETADEYGLVFAFDETFCGLGRTGMVWAHEWTGVTPDLMVSSQGLAGSLPLAALVVTQKVARGASASLPVADPAVLAAGHAVMDALLAPGFEERVQSRTWYFEDRLASLAYERRDLFRGTCGVGLMQGLVCAGAAGPIRAKLAERGLLARDMGSVLGLFPPLTVEESEIDAAISAIAMVCAGDDS